MGLSNEKQREYVMRLLQSRTRILLKNPFYGLLLMHVTYSLDESAPTAYTDGERIAFSPTFLEELTDKELDFVMMHEILHIVLRHCKRGNHFEPERYNIAADIVVNSNILYSNNMDLKSITLRKYGESMHLTPKKDEGYDYTAEEVYAMLSSPKGAGASGQGSGKPGANGNAGGKGGKASSQGGGGSAQGGFDDHSKWKGSDGENEQSTWEDGFVEDLWTKRIQDATELINIDKANTSRGKIPGFAERMIKELRKAQHDWRTVLHNFIQEEVVDYSFTPPDYRYDDSPFYLPAYNDTDIQVKNILFMIDTSGSMSNTALTTMYSEIVGAIEQFEGKLVGWLGFFDASVVEPIAFSDVEEFKVIRPMGGGGTDFGIIFKYIKKHMDEPPAAVIILTDGYAPFPDEKETNGVPILWVINNESVKPPYGKLLVVKDL